MEKEKTILNKLIELQNKYGYGLHKLGFLTESLGDTEEIENSVSYTNFKDSIRIHKNNTVFDIYDIASAAKYLSIGTGSSSEKRLLDFAEEKLAPALEAMNEFTKTNYFYQSKSLSLEELIDIFIKQIDKTNDAISKETSPYIISLLKDNIRKTRDNFSAIVYDMTEQYNIYFKNQLVEETNIEDKIKEINADSIISK